MNPTLRAELLEMRAADLRLREELVRDGSLFDGYNERMAELHRRHNARLALALAEYGWPGRALVDEDGAAAAWFLLQHAELSPLPIEEPATVDQRRLRVGLEPLAENTRRLRAQAEAEGERPPADYEKRRREGDAWARATGWRSREVDWAR